LDNRKAEEKRNGEGQAGESVNTKRKKKGREGFIELSWIPQYRLLVCCSN
jgi:hypothetical protein